MNVPAGVCAIQDATSSVKPKPVEYAGEVQLPTSYVRVVPRYGSL